MKVLKIFLMIFLALVILIGAGVYILVKTFKIERYKPQILAAAEKALARKVDFKDILLDINWSQGINIQLQDLVIKDHPVFQEGRLLRVPELSMGVDVFAYLMTRQIAIHKVKISAVELTLIRDAQGRINILTLGQEPAPVPVSPGPTSSEPAAPAAESSSQPAVSASSISPATSSGQPLAPKPAALPSIYIDEISLDNGTITYVDRSRPTELGFSITQIDALIKRFSLSGPFSVDLQAALLTGKKNFSLKGTVQWNQNTSEIKLKETDLATDLAQEVWEKLRFALGGFIKSALPAIANGQFSTHIKEMIVGPDGLKKANLEASLSNGNLQFRDAAPGVSLEASHINVSLKNFSLDGPFQFEASLGIFSPQPNVQILGTGRLNLPEGAFSLQDTVVKTDLGQWPLEKIQQSLTVLSQMPLPQTLQGQLQIDLKNLLVNPAGLKTMKVDAQWNNGVFVASDLAPGISVEAQAIGLKLNNFSLAGEPFGFLVSGALFGKDPNFSAGGTAAVDLEGKWETLANTQIVIDLGLLPLKKIQAHIADLQPIPLPQVLQGKMAAEIKEASLGAAGLEKLLASLKWSDGKIVMNQVQPNISLAADKVKFELVNFSLGQEPCSFVFEGGLFSEQPNLYADATLALDQKTKTIKMTDAHLASDLALWPLETLRQAIGPLQSLPFPKELKGKLSAEIKEMIADPSGLQTLVMDGQIQDGRIYFPNIAPGLTLEAANIILDAKDLSINGDPFKFVFQGALYGERTNLYAEGLMGLNLKGQTISLKNMDVSSDLALVPVGKIRESVAALKGVPFPENLKGKLDLAVKELTAGPKGLSVLHLDADLTDGAMEWPELIQGFSLHASHANVKLLGLDLSGAPFRFGVKAAVFGDKPNVVVNGTATLDLASQNISLSQTQLKADLAKISPDEIRSAWAGLKDVVLPAELGGLLTVDVSDLQASAMGIASLNLKSTLTDGHLKHPLLLLPVDPIAMDLDATAQNLNLNNLSFQIGEGTIQAKGQVQDYLGKQIYSADVLARNIDVKKIVDQSQQPVKLEGTIEGQYQISGEGFDPKKISETLSGIGQIQVKDSVLRDINVLKEILNKLTMFPKLEEKIQASGLPQDYQKTLQQKDTILEQVQFDSRLANGSLVINPAQIVAEGFSLRGDGKIGLDQSVAMSAAFLMAPDLSEAIIQAEPEFQFLMNAKGEIQFPVKIGGTLSKIAIAPDIQYIMRTAIENRGKQELQKVIQKALGIESPSTPSEPAPPSTEGGTNEPAPEEKKSSPQKIIGDILEGIFSH